MNGGFQGMAMNQMAYANMIGQPPGYYGGSHGGPNTMGDRLMGGAMNRGSAVGAPLMMGAMGMMGLDPMSLGLKAGIGAFTSGAGIGGALGAGALAAAPMAIGLAGAGYVGNQFMNGAQGQMQLNAGLRSSFNFQNQQGGQGFNRSDMTQIGGVLRSMTEQFGPGGEVTSFRELSSLTSKMGQMGLAQGVRDVQEFSKRFKEMVTSLKTMAKDLGTTLEGAMEFASAARGSGVFGMTNASKFATMARGTAVSGGLAMSEVTGAASIGSQISRSIGGLGSQGAIAGMRTIGQIGTAQQMGILSEEDIFNVTGMQGAEGRQAYAASQMQRTAGFLQSGRGRRVLASLAGKNGQLNESNVQELLTGGMTIGETMSKDKENLGQIGRANFIRNEGRLRGAAMARIGGFLPALQMMEWSRSKGIDINDMDDRSMLFAQRQLHMGRDEADQAIKMAQNLPNIMRQQRISSENDLVGQDYAQQRKQMGIEGIKTKFEQAREHINGKLQKVGQDVFNEGSEMIERFLNKLSGQYVQVMSEEADKAYRSAMYGGAVGQREMSRYFGKIPGRLQGLGQALGGGGAEGGPSSRLQQMASAAGGPAGADLVALGKGNSKWMNDFYATSLSGLQGEDRMNKFGAELAKQAGSNPAAAKAAERWKQASPVERARIMSGLEAGAGIDQAATLAATFKLPSGSAFTKGFATEGERNEAFSEALVGRSSGVAGAIGAGIGGTLGTILGPLGIAAGAAIGGSLGEKLLGDKGTRQAIGSTLASDQYRRHVSDVFSSDQATREAGVANVQKELQRLEGQSGDEIQGRRTALQALLASDEFQRSGGSEQDAAKILDKYKSLGAMGVKGAAGLRKVLEGEASIYATQQRDIVLGQARRRQKVGAAEAGSLERMGLATFDGGEVRLSATTSKALEGIKGGADILKAAFGATAKEASLNLTDAGAAAAGLEGASASYQDFSDRLAGMSVADKRKLAALTAGTSAGGMISESAAVQDRIARARGKKGNLGAAASGFGLSVSKEEMKQFGGPGASLEMQENLLLGKMGIGTGASKEMRDQVGQVLQAISKGDTGKAAQLSMGIQSSKEFEDAQKKKTEESAAERDPFGKQTVDLLKELTPRKIAEAISTVDLKVAQKDNAEGKPTGTG